MTGIGRALRTAVAASMAVAALQPTTALALDEPQTLVRAGDRAMSCEALAAEINTLANAGARSERPRRRGGLGVLRALGAASPLLGAMGSGVMGMAAGQAVSMAQQEAATSGMDEAMAASIDAASGRQSVAEQRKARLTGIFEEKGC